MYKILIIVFILFLIYIYHTIMLNFEKVKYKPVGKLISIDEHKMHITRNGKGTPTIIMTCGSGAPTAISEFSLMEPKLSKISRTCIYERPGYGWSEKATTPRNTEQIVNDLKRLLKQANETPPYLFIAHSFGAMEVLLYAQKYPDEVSGIVLIDGTSPYKHIIYPKSSVPIVFLHLLRIINKVGLIRILVESKLIFTLNKRLNIMPKEIRNLEKAMIYKNISNKMVLMEGVSIKQTAEKIEESINLNNKLIDKPILIFVAEHSMKKLPGWAQSQKSLLALSKNSKMFNLKNTNHISIMLNYSDKIVNEIKTFILKNN